MNSENLFSLVVLSLALIGVVWSLIALWRLALASKRKRTRMLLFAGVIAPGIWVGMFILVYIVSLLGIPNMILPTVRS